MNLVLGEAQFLISHHAIQLDIDMRYPLKLFYNTIISIIFASHPYFVTENT